MTNNAVAPESETTDVLTGDSIQTEPFYVNEYLINKVFGGPEEGGWWYNVGKFERCHGVYVSVALAINRRKALMDWVEEKRGRKASVISTRCCARDTHGCVSKNTLGRTTHSNALATNKRKAAPLRRGFLIREDPGYE